MQGNGIILFAIIAGCLSCHPKPLGIKELKDDDIERAFRVKANVDTVYHISSNEAFHYLDSDTIGYSVYNKQGYLVRDDSYSFMCCEVTLHYDSSNQVITRIFDTDYSDWQKTTYNWDPETLTLTRYYENDSSHRFFYRYDYSGRLAESMDYNLLSGSGFPYHSFFTYDDAGLLMEKNVRMVMDETERYRRERKTGYALPTDIHSKYYYTYGIPDSVLTHYKHAHKPGDNYYLRTYYNDSGLKSTTIQADTFVISYGYGSPHRY